MSSWSDDEVTPRVVPPGERDDSGIRRRTPAAGVSAFEIPVDASEVTDPISWLEGDLDAETRDLVERSGRGAGQATPWGQTAKVIVRSDQHEQKSRDRHRMVVRALNELRGAVDPKLGERIARTEMLLRRARSALIWAGGILLGSIGHVAYRALDQAEQQGAATQRLMQVEQGVRQLGEDIRELRRDLGRRSELHPEPSAVPTASFVYMKGPNP